MTVTGIIAEYNPFHNGHKYQIEQARKVTGADYIVIIMSGDFMQRGMPALMDKHARAYMALQNGADLVIELPVCYACGSAEYFAKGSISLLNQLGIVDYLCFGSECGELSKLEKIAEILNKEPVSYRSFLQAGLKEGLSYPAARARALHMEFPDFSMDFLGAPNNILGIEYIKALLESNSSIKPVTIERVGNSYHDKHLRDSVDGFSSAKALRHILSDLDSPLSLDSLSSQVPPSVLSVLKWEYQLSYPVLPADFSSQLHYKLMLEEAKGYTHYLDMNEDLSDKFLKYLYEYKDPDSFCDLLKSKDLTYTRINRALCHILLSITKEDLTGYLENGITFYANALGLRQNQNELTHAIKEHSQIPLITQPAKATALLNDMGKKQYIADLTASHIYESVISDKFNTPMKNEFQRKIMTV